MAAKSRRKRLAEARNKKEGKQILTVVVVATIIFMILLYILFQSR